MGFTPSVGVDVADVDVLLLGSTVLDEVLLVEMTELVLEVLVGTFELKGAHTLPRLVTSLKSSMDEPLDTPYFVPVAEEIE